MGAWNSSPLALVLSNVILFIIMLLRSLSAAVRASKMGHWGGALGFSWKVSWTYVSHSSPTAPSNAKQFYLCCLCFLRGFP